MAVPTKSKGRRIITVMIFKAFLGSPVPITTSHVLVTFSMSDVDVTNSHLFMALKAVVRFKFFLTFRTLDFFFQFHFFNA